MVASEDWHRENGLAESSAGRVPIEEGLYAGTAESLQLIASKCGACGEVTFPKQQSCPNCAASGADEILLSRRGTLWTWTVQRFPPTSPPFIGPADRDAFVPFGVGYVDLPEGVRVEARLTENDPAKLEIGMEMELVAETFIEDEKGNELQTFAFRPVES